MPLKERHERVNDLLPCRNVEEGLWIVEMIARSHLDRRSSPTRHVTSCYLDTNCVSSAELTCFDRRKFDDEDRSLIRIRNVSISIRKHRISSECSLGIRIVVELEITLEHDTSLLIEESIRNRVAQLSDLNPVARIIHINHIHEERRLDRLKNSVLEVRGPKATTLRDEIAPVLAVLAILKNTKVRALLTPLKRRERENRVCALPVTVPNKLSSLNHAKPGCRDSIHNARGITCAVCRIVLIVGRQNLKPCSRPLLWEFRPHTRLVVREALLLRRNRGLTRGSNEVTILHIYLSLFFYCYYY